MAHVQGAGALAHMDGAGALAHVDGAGALVHMDGAGALAHMDGALAQQKCSSSYTYNSRIALPTFSPYDQKNPTTKNQYSNFQQYVFLLQCYNDYTLQVQHKPLVLKKEHKNKKTKTKKQTKTKTKQTNKRDISIGASLYLTIKVITTYYVCFISYILRHYLGGKLVVVDHQGHY